MKKNLRLNLASGLRLRPAFECLEDRVVPALFTITTLADTVDATPGDGQAVDSAGNTSLRAAIMEANALAGADTIQLIAGTHLLSLTGRGENAANTGDLDVTDSSGLTILGFSTPAAVSTIDANGIDRVFQIFPSVSLRLVNVVVRGGSESTGAGFANQGNLTIEDSVVRNNTATLRGGGVDNNGGALTVRNSTFSSNVAGDFETNGLGGAISSPSGSFSISDSTFSSNTAFVSGGALFTRSANGTITRSTLSGNRAEAAAGSGGAIVVEGGIVTISDSTLSSNVAAKAGAVMGRGEVTISGSLLRGNQATIQSATANVGGAIVNENFMKVVNSTIVENVAGSTYPFIGLAGAIENTGGFQLIHATVTGNRAHDGGGVRNSATGTFTVTNSIIAQNTTIGGNRLDVWGAFNSLGGNFLGYAGGGTGWIASDQRSNGLLDPQLGTLQDNGGPTLTRASLSGSPVRDRGVTAAGFPANVTLPTTDQRGLQRPSGTGYDVGAYEYQAANNNAPVAANDSYNTYEDTERSVSAPGVLFNDFDADGNLLSAVLVSGPAHGTLSLSANGAFVYTPEANYHGQDSFTYQASDGGLLSNVATVTILIAPLNDAPVAANDSYSTDEDTVLSGASVLGNDSDVEGDALTASLVAGPSHGTLTLNTNGTFTYTPSGDYNGSDSFTYRANDGATNGNTATVSITIRPVNDAPVAANDSYSTDEDTALNGATVLGNDTDVDGNTLSAILVAGPSHGSLTLNGNGTFVYTPTGNYNGSDSFTYKAKDGSLDSNTATVNITIRPVNDAPVAVNDSNSTDEDTVLNGTTVLANDSDVDGDTLSAILVAGPSHGALTLNSNGTFTYTPSANYNGPDSFTYKAKDGSADSNTATVNLTIRPVNDAPAAVNDSYSTDEDNALSGTTVLGNDTDVDADTLSAALVAGPSHGTLTFNTDGAFTYTPSANYDGSDSFTYQANDGTADSNTATVNLTIRPVNDAPVAANNSYSTDEDTTLNGTPVLGNDSDVDGDALSAILVAGPSHGSLTLNADGTFTYTPSANYNGADSFTYKANDGNADSNTATVTITIRPVNDAPVAANDGYSTNEDNPLNGSTVLSNDGDVDSDALSAILVSGPSHGSLTLNTDGTFTYTPSANYNGSDSFTYRAGDGNAGSNTATVTIQVRAVNDAPLAGNDSFATSQGVLLNVAADGVLGNDSDADGDDLAAALVAGPYHGTLSLNADGSFTYNPDPAFSGTDSFTYRAGDGSLSSNLATVALNVASAPSNAGKITGGGWLDGGARKFNINIESREQRGGFRYSGDLDFYDSVNNIRLKSSAISFFRVESDGRGLISGQATMNGRTGYSFTLFVEDRSAGDRFRIVIGGPAGFAYDSIDFASAAGLLESGNVQAHWKR